VGGGEERQTVTIDRSFSLTVTVIREKEVLCLRMPIPLCRAWSSRFQGKMKKNWSISNLFLIRPVFSFLFLFFVFSIPFIVLKGQNGKVCKTT
jgi:hypothetical protein